MILIILKIWYLIIYFFNTNELKYLKVISIINHTKVKVIKYDILNNNTIRNEMEFDKELATTLIENEYSWQLGI